MARLIAALIRHGEYRQLPDTPSAHQPFPLTTTGERQARAAAAHIADFADREQLEICADIDCSNLQRAWQTAALLAESLHANAASGLRVDATLHSFNHLNERGVGSAANLSCAQIEAILDRDPRYLPAPEDWKADSNYRLPFPGAESLMEAGDRCASHIEGRMLALRQTATTDTLKLFVGHGAAFRHAAFLMGLLSIESIASLSMHHAKAIYIELLADGRWQHCGGTWKKRGETAQTLD